jgi:hypothetical protein
MARSRGLGDVYKRQHSDSFEYITVRSGNDFNSLSLIKLIW